jgi:hypothetical protein
VEERTDRAVRQSKLGSGELRVSDAEREQVATQLRQAAGQGRLSLAEIEDRQAAAYAARTRDDLAGLTADLPEPAPPDTSLTRQLSAPERRRLGLHAVIAAAVALLLVLRWAAGPVSFFWPAWPMVWLTLSIAAHYRWRTRRSGRATRPPVAAPADHRPSATSRPLTKETA